LPPKTFPLFREKSYPCVTSLFRGTAFSALGRVKVKTPSAILAVIFPWSVISERVNYGDVCNEQKSLTYLLLSAVVLNLNFSYVSGNVEIFGFLVGEIQQVTPFV